MMAEEGVQIQVEGKQKILGLKMVKREAVQLLTEGDHQILVIVKVQMEQMQQILGQVMVVVKLQVLQISFLEMGAVAIVWEVIVMEKVQGPFVVQERVLVV